MKNFCRSNNNKMSINLQLKKFDISKIGDNRIVTIIGKRGTGKSWLMKDIMYHKRYIPVGAVISPTERVNRFFGKFVPKLFIHDEYHQSLLINFRKRQFKMAKLMDEGESEIDPYAYLIFDDCLYDNSWKNDKYIREVFFNYRHLFCLFLLSLQFPLGISPQLRGNIDYIFIFRENIVSNRKRLYEHYAGMFKTFEMFCSVLDQCTENFECLVIDNTIQSNKIEDQIYWYRAEDHGNFRVGPDNVWDYCDQNYIDDELEDEININTYHNTKKGPKLNVKKIETERYDNHKTERYY